jgi:hypothetical protein
MVRRIILEWGLILCLASSLAPFTLWVVTGFFDRSSHHLRVSMTRSVQQDIHVILCDGRLALSNQFEMDSSGRIRPLILDAKGLTKGDISMGVRRERFSIPGVDLGYHWSPRPRSLIWSLEQSLLIPGGLLLLLTAWLRIRLGKLKVRVAQQPSSSVGTGSQTYVKSQP